MEEASQSQPEKNYSAGYGKRPLWQWVVIYLVIGAIVYGLVYYFVFAKKGGYNYNSTTQNQTPSEAVTSTPAAEASPSAGANSMQVTVTGSEFAFVPATITVKVGQQVTLTFKNTGKYSHNFTITELNVATKTIQPGQEDTITFTPDKAGSFTYMCTVPGHADRGMKGTLTVQ